MSSSTSSGSASSGASSSGSGSQSLFSRLFPNFDVNYWLVAGVAASAGLAYAGFQYLSAKRAEDERAKKRKHFLRLQSSFQSEGNAIVEAVYEAPWCQLSLATVKKMHKAFGKHIANHPEDGRISRADFGEIYRKLGLKDDKVIESLFRVWDENSDGHVDFQELAEGINTVLNGTLREKLNRYFRAFDLDSNGFIEKQELVRVYKACFAGVPDEELSRRASDFIRLTESVQSTERMAQTHHADRISYDDFIKLADRMDYDLSGADEFNKSFLREFGIDDPKELARAQSWAAESTQ